MASIGLDRDDHHGSSKLPEYQLIFEHYGFREPSLYSDDDLAAHKKNHVRHRYETRREILEKNASNKKTINAKSMGKKSKPSSAKSPVATSKKSKSTQNKGKVNGRDGMIKIPVPEAARARKATYSGSQRGQQLTQSPKTKSSVPKIAVHAPSSSTVNTVQKLPEFNSRSSRSVSSDVPSRANKPVPRTPSMHSAGAGEPSSTSQLQVRKHDSRSIPKPSSDYGPVWDLDEINRFTKEIFRVRTKDDVGRRSYRVRLNCPVHPDDHLTKYVHSRSHCLDVFEEHVNALKRQHGLVQPAASDQPIYDPGISITGPQVKTATATIDKEDSRTIKKLVGMEPRKKYALVHEISGIFVIGGYNLHADVPVQKEPETDYLFKFSGEVVKIPPLKPCRIHFGIYTDGNAIYVAGGQTIQNELLDDIQRLNLRTLKWERVTTLMNPVAACGMTLDDNRIYLVGGYDIVHDQTIFLNDYIVYNTASRQFEPAADLPSPRCRSLVFATDHAIFCISGLVETRNADDNKQMKISTDILKWTRETSEWVKISQTPTLTKFHALSFTGKDPYLEVTKRVLDNQSVEGDTIEEAYYDFQNNIWNNGRAPKSPASSSATAAKRSTRTPKTPSKSKGNRPTKSPSKSNSKVAKSPSKQKPSFRSQSPSKTTAKKPNATKRSKKK